MSRIRVWHSYLGMIIAPSVLFFALTGALQIYSLHEAHGGYTPLPLLEKLASVHKDQVFALPERHEPDAASDQGASTPKPRSPGAGEEEREPVATALLKAYFLMIAIGLALSTVFGLWMGLAQVRNKRIHVLLLIIGALLPPVLLLL